MKKIQFNTDCEGPISLNDNAYELARHFIPDGDRFFAQLSKYDDILADIVRRTGYKAGDTLKLILPFLKAYGATNKRILEYSAGNIILVSGAESSLKYISDMMPAFIISTSYEPYLNALCDLVGFDREHVYCTKLDLNRYVIGTDEVKRLKEVREEINSLPKLEFNTEVRTFHELPDQVRDTVKRLDTFFWEEIRSMRSGEMLEDVNPIGGVEKANALLHSLRVTGNHIQDVLYVGDSITDSDVLNMVKRGGGLAVSFNGNGYAIRESDVACISDHTVVVSIIACTFLREGKTGVMDLAKEWSPGALKGHGVDKILVDQLLNIRAEGLPAVEIIRDDNTGRITAESEAFRKTVRGRRVGSLG